eukprot:6232799-Alexandrium_andersonii.AAC.1
MGPWLGLRKGRQSTVHSIANRCSSCAHWDSALCIGLVVEPGALQDAEHLNHAGNARIAMC